MTMSGWFELALELLAVGAACYAAYAGAKGGTNAAASARASSISVGMAESIKGLSVNHAEIRARQLSPDELSPTLPMVCGPDGNPDCFYAFVIVDRDDKEMKRAVTVPLYVTTRGSRRLNDAMSKNAIRAIGLVRHGAEDHVELVDVLQPSDRMKKRKRAR